MVGRRYLSKKGCLYDNAAIETAFKVVKTKFALIKIFASFEELEYVLFDYVNWYKNHRIYNHNPTDRGIPEKR